MPQFASLGYRVSVDESFHNRFEAVSSLFWVKYTHQKINSGFSTVLKKCSADIEPLNSQPMDAFKLNWGSLQAWQCFSFP